MLMIVDPKRCILACILVSAFVGAGTHDSFSQFHAVLPSVSAPAPFRQIQAPASPTPPLYETRAIHDPNGTGKFYMGREIAQVMGPGGIPWLNRPERDDQEKPSIVLDALKLRGGETVVDLGAGSGYFTFRIAPRVGRAGKVLAVEIQDEMLQTIRQRAQALKVTNVEAVKGSETDPNLPVNGVDL